MGASDSKLVFKQGIFRLAEQKDIPANDRYWTGFWELPESSEDVFSLFSPADIRRTRDTALGNLETLILAVISRLCVLRNHPSFPDPELAPERDALNCIRVLTRVLPYIYEADHLESWEDRFFWAKRRRKTRRGTIRPEVLFDEAEKEDLPAAEQPEYEEVKPLAEELVDTLVDLLFYSDFTVPPVQPGKAKVSYAIWQSGVGCNTAAGTSREYENNRTEILRLLLTMASKSLYMSPSVLPLKGVETVTYMTTTFDKQTVLSLLCSLLNTTLKYNPATWRVPYDHVVFKDPRQTLVTYCLQLLLTLVLYPVPESTTGTPPRNLFRHFLGRLHRPQDFQFLVDGMTRVLKQPLQATTSYLPGSQKSLTWSPEMIMLFWEMLQCNKRFRSFIIDTDRAHDFIVLVLFHAMEQKDDPAKQGVTRMCIFVLQTLSVEPSLGKSLNKTFEGQESLPQSIRIPKFHGTYADYLVISIYNLITAGKGKLEAIYPALLAIINNIAAYIERLSSAASNKLMHLFASMSSPSFLLANETNHTLLQAVLEAINAIVEHQYHGNARLIYAILCSRKRFQSLRDFTLESGQEDIERQNQLRKERSSGSDAGRGQARSGSTEIARSPANARAPSLSNVPEENTAFAIGDDDSDDDAEAKPTPSHSSQQSGNTSRAASVSSSLDDAVPLQLRGMSEKARGKMPAGQPSFLREGSTTSLNSFVLSTSTTNGAWTPTPAWIESWLADLPLHAVLTLISQLTPQLPLTRSSRDPEPVLEAIRSAEIRGIEPSPIRVHLFEWSPLSLGWYESLLWGLIFSNEMAVSNGAAGVWNGTNIKLFKVQEAVAQGPSLLSPRGAVDAVGSNLVQRIGSLNLRGGSTPVGQRSTSGRGNGSFTLYTYPIKSLRGTPLTHAEVTGNGFRYDRTFLLIRIHPDASRSGSKHCYGCYENMHVAAFTQMTLFLTDIAFPSNEEEEGTITVTYRPPEELGAAAQTLQIPLQPDTNGLDVLEVVMHNSPTRAYDMGSRYREWFSRCFGFDVMLAYIGENLRPVLGNLSPNVASGAAGWLSSIAASIPFFGSSEEEREGITFADCAPILIVSSTSLRDVSARLPDGLEMDVTKFRPNIVVDGAREAYEEDFWAGVNIGGLDIVITANCARCVSINIDYKTGRPGAGEDGKVMKLLQRDRRVDRGMKYSPVFGRYGFPAKGSVGSSVAVGDEVRVTRMNGERTVFQWPGLSN